jgi:hypothetical protein
MTTRQEQARAAVVRARQTLEDAQAALKMEDAHEPYSEPELQAQLIEALGDLRAEISGTWQGLGESHRAIADAHADGLIAAIDANAKMIREAIGQHRLRQDHEANNIKGAIQSEATRINCTLAEGLKLIAEATRAGFEHLTLAIRDGRPQPVPTTDNAPRR